MAKVALIKGENRYENVLAALREIEDEIQEKIQGKKRIVLKPNFVSTRTQLAASHVDAARAVLDFLKPQVKGRIIVAEGAAGGSAQDGFENFGYFQQLKDYDIEFQDLEEDEFVEASIVSRDSEPMKAGLAKSIVDSDFRISLANLKTHDTVIATLTLKNIIVGSLENKPAIHQGTKAINLSLAKLAEVIPPHLSVIDGFEAMEGDGPVDGTLVDMRVALAGTDFLAVDTVGVNLMGFDISQIGYLYYCKERGLGEGDLSKIEVVGNTSLEEVRRKFKPHCTFPEQLKWK